MPVYNGGGALEQSLDSLLGQTVADLEIICVDDGSSDGSDPLLERYAEMDPRIRVLRQERAGAGAARNAGLALARSEYIAFLDCDDVFRPTLVEYCTERLTRSGADICVFGATQFSGDALADA